MKNRKVAWLIAVAVIATAAVIIAVNRPAVNAPQGTAVLDNRLDTAGVEHLIVDEAGVLTKEAKRIFSIYNANWSALKHRVMAVVIVERTDDAETDAWKWAQKLSLGADDALLLIETQGAKSCVLVSGGSFREDIETLHDAIVTSLTYTNLKAGEFGLAVLAVFERLHYFCGYDPVAHRQIIVREGLTTFAILAALMLPILIHMLAEMIDRRRFKQWYSFYGASDPTKVPWKAMFPWHRVGSKWYEVRMNGEWIDYRRATRNASLDMRAKIAEGRYR